jgi:hypothetical protein
LWTSRARGKIRHFIRGKRRSGALSSVSKAVREGARRFGLNVKSWSSRSPSPSRSRSSTGPGRDVRGDGWQLSKHVLEAGSAGGKKHRGRDGSPRRQSGTVKRRFASAAWTT